MVRRKRQGVALELPRHLWLDQAGPDPVRWKLARFEWARQHSWPAGQVGFAAFFRETREAFYRAVGPL